MEVKKQRGTHKCRNFTLDYPFYLFPDDRFNFTSGDMYYPNRNFNRYFNADCGTFLKSENENHRNVVGTTTKKGPYATQLIFAQHLLLYPTEYTRIHEYLDTYWERLVSRNFMHAIYLETQLEFWSSLSNLVSKQIGKCVSFEIELYNLILHVLLVLSQCFGLQIRI